MEIDIKEAKIAFRKLRNSYRQLLRSSPDEHHVAYELATVSLELDFIAFFHVAEIVDSHKHRAALLTSLREDESLAKALKRLSL